MRDISNLAKSLKFFRAALNLTQKEVADNIGITYQSYQAYERGIAFPTLQNFIKIANLFDVTCDDLLE